MIESYNFGKIIINSEEYHSDIIIYKNSIDDKWWRRESHNLCIEDIKKIMDSKVKLDPYPYLKKGRLIRLKSGPLKGIEGILIERKGSYNLVVRIDLLQKSAIAEVSVADVEPL